MTSVPAWAVEQAKAYVTTLDIDPNEVDRVILHWTGGGGFVSALDRRHYNGMIDQANQLHVGIHDVEDQVSTSDGIYGAHTRMLNSKSFGLALCGMAGASLDSRGFNAGTAPITEEQFMLAAAVCAFILIAAGLPVARHTVLSHAEVEPILGIEQNGKWDIARLPWRGDITGAIQVGDYFRSLAADVARKHAPVETFRADPPSTIRIGARGPAVTLAQSQLKDRGYAVGKVDGAFGQRTRAAVLAFQADNDLVADGVVGPRTWEKLKFAEALPERKVDEFDLRDGGSRTIKVADEIEEKSKTGAALAGGTATLDVAVGAVNSVAQSKSALETLQTMIVDNWIALAVLGLAAVLYFYGPKLARTLREIRLDDARKGRNLGI